MPQPGDRSRPAPAPGAEPDGADQFLGFFGLLLGITGLFVFGPIMSVGGLVVSGLALGRGRRAGRLNMVALIGLVVSAVAFVLFVVAVVTH
ncbi:hypothetical protein [Cellulomonas sp. PhB143]|uniref:hypothetical protein n=1 Tax=Cellulomonas sp. PhB143 TaxID=2485186 RepID=UPI000F47DB25|nr:hypothetical protein [Cellulomonas sp. PhB143]ROS75608.1 hypothetical protein EDF32_2022 [Cellulomonas sp. PhB143]